MSARDELFDMARSVIDGELGIMVNGSDIDNTADSISYAILAAGYRKPRTITTAEELDALGRGVSVLDAGGRVWTNDGDSLDQWGCVHHDEYPCSLVWRGSADIALPATVLHEGTTP